MRVWGSGWSGGSDFWQQQWRERRGRKRPLQSEIGAALSKRSCRPEFSRVVAGRCCGSLYAQVLESWGSPARRQVSACRCVHHPPSPAVSAGSAREGCGAPASTRRARDWPGVGSAALSSPGCPGAKRRRRRPRRISSSTFPGDTFSKALPL